MKNIILHFLERSTWIAAQEIGEYKPESLDKDGFIHCSTLEQVTDSANKWAEENADLLLLIINEKKVDPEIKYEKIKGSRSKVEYPHIYGRLNLDAVKKVHYFKKDDKGKYQLPKVLQQVLNPEPEEPKEET